MPGLRPLEDTGPAGPMWTVWTMERAEKTARRNGSIPDFEDFRGVAASEGVTPGLFPLAATGADVASARQAARKYLDGLTFRQAADGRFPMWHGTWRQWMNGARYFGRHGQCLEDLDDAGRTRALDVIRASLSAEGFTQVLDMMHLNRTIGEIRDELELLNEWLYWFSVYGSPEKDGEPWGWQLDGHHVAVNCVFIGDQMTLTPTFLGAEPVVAEGGKYAGTRAFGPEEAGAAALLTSLGEDQRVAARLGDTMPADLFTGAYRDNFELDYEGIGFEDLTAAQRALALDLTGIYVDRAPDAQAKARMEEIRAHAARTYFSWTGSHEPGGTFYYRIHSPVILIEFEHMPGAMFDNDTPSRNHIHTVVRTPNGNDYGADLLRQHHERSHTPPRCA